MYLGSITELRIARGTWKKNVSQWVMSLQHFLWLVGAAMLLLLCLAVQRLSTGLCLYQLRWDVGSTPEYDLVGICFVVFHHFYINFKCTVGSGFRIRKRQAVHERKPWSPGLCGHGVTPSCVFASKKLTMLVQLWNSSHRNSSGILYA